MGLFLVGVVANRLRGIAPLQSCEVGVLGGIITMVGSREEVTPWTGPATRVISQPGGMVLPGFQDAHIHAFQSALDLYKCDMHLQPYSMQAYLNKVRECAAAVPGDGWITGEGWSPNAFSPSGYPHKKMLDDIMPGRPVFLLNDDAHIGWANSR